MQCGLRGYFFDYVFLFAQCGLWAVFRYALSDDDEVELIANPLIPIAMKRSYPIFYRGIMHIDIPLPLLSRAVLK